VPTQTKKQAEVNVLRVVPGKAKKWQMPGLVDTRTHLLLDNTEAVCRGRGQRYGGRRYTRFVCVVRPHVHVRHQGAYLSYRALPEGRFTLRFLGYRRR
jgi:hypothetical protein